MELLETLSISEAEVSGEYDILKSEYGFQPIDGVDPIDAGCPSVGRCIGALTRVSRFSVCPARSAFNPFGGPKSPPTQMVAVVLPTSRSLTDSQPIDGVDLIHASFPAVG